MNTNPYQAPLENSPSPTASRNTIANVGFSLSVLGLIGLFLSANTGSVMGTVGLYMVLLCLPGIVASLVGYFRTPQRLARWGLGLGIIGAMYLPTLFRWAFMPNGG